MGTVPGFDVGQRSVGLSVPGQIARRTVTFPTIRTLTFLIVVVRLLRRLFRTYRITVVIINIVFLNVLFISIWTVDDRGRVLSEVDDANLSQLR